MVPWRAGGDQADHRSKTYINLLKIRLTYHHPEKCGAVVRNEAHVRLASSTWYVARVLRLVGILAAVIVLCAFGRGLCLESGAHFLSVSYKYLPALIPPVFVLWMAVYCKRKIEEVLHYQRLREVCFVLETAYTAFCDNPGLLNPPFEKFTPSRSGSPAPSPADENGHPSVSRCPLVAPQASRCPLLRS